jgi:hypothetical protein
MRTAALVLGIVGGVFVIIGRMVAIMIGGVAMAFEADGAGTVGGLGFVGVLLGISGIIGGALAGKNPKIAGIIEAASGILGFVAISLFWIAAGASLIAGAVLALMASREKPTTEGASS